MGRRSDAPYPSGLAMEPSVTAAALSRSHRRDVGDDVT